MSRMEALEKIVTGREPVVFAPHIPQNGAWRGDDFSI
jgi:hypothetical protein